MLAKLTLSAVVLAMTTAAASALTFDFRNPAVPNDGVNTWDGTYTQTISGLTVTATAGWYIAQPGPNDTIVHTDCSSAPCLLQVSETDQGLGISDAGGNLPDLNGTSDLLTLTFSKKVNFNNVLFAGNAYGWPFGGENGVDADDDFDLFVDGVLVLPEDRNILAGGNPYPLGGLMGHSISFGADEIGPFGFHSDNFTIAAIDVTAVPLPAPALLLLTGLGGFAVFRRRKG